MENTRETTETTKTVTNEDTAAADHAGESTGSNTQAVKTGVKPKADIVNHNENTCSIRNYSQIITILQDEKKLTAKQIEYARRIQSKLENERTLLEVLKELKYISDEEIKEVIRSHQIQMKLGDLLVELGYISDENLQVALQIQCDEEKRRMLGEILLERHLITEDAFAEILALQLGIPKFSPVTSEIDEKLLYRASKKWLESHNLLPIHEGKDGVLIAFWNPLDNREIEEAKEIFGNRILRAIATKSDIHQTINNILSRKENIKNVEVDENSVINIVHNIILAAIEASASDIHIEPLKDRLQIRFRQDGVLNHFKDFPLEIIPMLTSRLKVMCDLDITEKRRHQGGRLLFEHSGGELDLRVSFYVTVHGEKIVLRLLNRQGQLLSLTDIGILPHMLERFKEEALLLPSGVILITGPTGSGKTTTVYSCINELKSPDISIVTAEEPVEYVIDGISQCSINPKINLTFNETLRHIVRQDPDVILVGEIRDNFSAEVSVQAALTGHKVLTTFHTEDSIGGLIRLLNMNIEAFLVSSTVVSVLAQRLLRKICPSCAEPYRPSLADIRRLGYNSNVNLGGKFLKGKGCSQCQYTGYKGRIGAFELLVLDESVREAIINQKTSQEIRKISIESTGLVTLLEDGIYKAAHGLTTIEELLRCLPRVQKPRTLEALKVSMGKT